ncbi:hypothetical protein IBX73_00745 [candidate division WOR-3 bacterium]|nr:hypothetical protein [candidate division WOR-3 bacterium]
MHEHQLTRIRESGPTQVWYMLVLAACFVGSRLPMLFLGFGLDPDAWRIANTSFDLRYHLAYHTSRFPGYPVPEFVNSLAITRGWAATNTLTMLLSLVSVFILERIAGILAIRNRNLLIFTYAFLPILWINSTNTMDYMWSLCFILLTWLLILKHRWLVAGIAMGLAIGSRPQAAILALPFIYLCYSISGGKRRTIEFLVSSVITTFLLFAPLVSTYGLSFVKAYPVSTDVLQIGYMAIRHFGLPAISMLILTVLLSYRDLHNTVAQHNTRDVFFLLALLLALASFIAIDGHVEYVIIFIPFALMFIYQTCRRPLLIILSVLLISHAFITVGSFKHLGEKRLQVRIFGPGAIFNNIEARRTQLSYGRELANTDIPARSVVIAGTWLPVLANLDADVSSCAGAKRMYDCNRPRAGVRDFNRDVCYRYLAGIDEIAAMKNDNYHIFYIDGAVELTARTYGFDLALHAMRLSTE